MHTPRGTCRGSLGKSLKMCLFWLTPPQYNNMHIHYVFTLSFFPHPPNDLCCTRKGTLLGCKNIFTSVNITLHLPAPWTAGPCGRPSGCRPARWRRCRGRDRRGQAWGSTAAGWAAWTQIRRSGCWPPGTSVGSPSHWRCCRVEEPVSLRWVLRHQTIGALQ